MNELRTTYAARLLPAIWAAAKKELKIFFRYPTWPLSLLIWPSLFPLLYVLTCRALAGPQGEALGAYAARAGTSDYVGFILTGTTLWMWLNVMLWSFGTSLRTEQLRGTLEVNWLAPVAKWFVLAGSSLADMVWQGIFLVITGVEFYFLFGFRVHGSPALLLVVMLFSTLNIYGLGFVFASLVLWAKESSAAVKVVRGVMMIFCGMTYPVAILPGWMQTVSRILPLTHSIDAARAVVSGSDLGMVAADLQYLFVSGAVLLALGLAAFSLTQRTVSQSGALSHY